MMHLTLTALAFSAVIGAAGPQGYVTKEAVPGVTNFAQLETTVACGGVITSAAIAELQTRGFKSIFDLQLPDEKGADVSGEAAAAQAAGLIFVHVPFTPAHPDNDSVDTFVREISKPTNTPAFIHCSGGNRAAGFWMIKRALVDNWDVPRAQAEAEALGLASPQMKQFALDYIQAHKH
jgi:uncharacterized protein (TIGR01244 family)